MEIAVKIIVVAAFFSTLFCFGIWAQQKIEEYKEFWKDDEDGR